ncbi:MAG TPA: hypothetical protein VIY52_04990 [Streptosporangiaceae bacterium]
MNGDEEAAVVTGPCPVPPGEPAHPAAAPASTTLSKAPDIGLGVALLAGAGHCHRTSRLPR